VKLHGHVRIVINMAIEGVSNWANKVYDAMKSAGITAEDKMKTADDITKLAKISKAFVSNSLIELENKGYAKRVARHKAAGYYLLK